MPRASTPRPSRCIRRALAIREKALGPDHPDTATSLNNLAVLLRCPGQATPRPSRCTARRWRSARRRWARTTPTRPPASTTWPCSTEARASYAEAEPLLPPALAIREKVLGPDHPDTRHQLQQPGRTLPDARASYAEAEPLLPPALEIREKVLGPDHPDTATSLNNLAVLYQAQGDYAEAEPLYPPCAGDPREGAGPGPPRHRHQPQQPGLAATRRQGELRRGRAAVPPRAGDPREGAGPGPPRHRRQPQQPGGAAAGARAAGGEPLFRRVLGFSSRGWVPGIRTPSRFVATWTICFASSVGAGRGRGPSRVRPGPRETASVGPAPRTLRVRPLPEAIRDVDSRAPEGRPIIAQGVSPEVPL